MAKSPFQWKRLSGVRSGARRLALSVLMILASSCSEDVATEPVVPAEQGALQPEGGGDAIVEEEACQRLADAIADKDDELDCDVALECPEGIRPAGGEACLEYDEETVEACVSVIESYEECEEFDTRPCIATALAGTADPACAPAGGAGGMAGTAGGGGAGG
jgi:hypothetical protein